MEIFRTAFDPHFTGEDSKKNIPFVFSVPAGVTRLLFDLTYQPAAVDGIRNLLTLTIFDPQGWRGEIRQSWPVSDDGSQNWAWKATQSGWGLVTLRGSQGKMLALTNPIYFDFRT